MNYWGEKSPPFSRYRYGFSKFPSCAYKSVMLVCAACSSGYQLVISSPITDAITWLKQCISCLHHHLLLFLPPVTTCISCLACPRCLLCALIAENKVTSVRRLKRALCHTICVPVTSTDNQICLFSRLALIFKHSNQKPFVRKN